MPLDAARDGLIAVQAQLIEVLAARNAGLEARIGEMEERALQGRCPTGLSASAGLSSVELLFGVSCLPDAGGNTTCYAGGTVQAQPGTDESTSVVLVSHDDGASWAQVEGLTDNGWFNSISCASTQNCWAGGAGTTDALAGTSDAGSSWSVVTSDTSNEGGYVSCLSVSTRVAVTDNGVWVTSDDGGLTPAS
jgi:hypothetical protein